MHLLRSNKDECECVPLLLSHHNETYQNAALKTARGIWTRSAQTYEGTHRAATNRLTKDSRTATSVVPSLPHHVIVISSYVYKINSVSRAVVNYLFILMSVLHIHYSWGAFGLSSWSDADRETVGQMGMEAWLCPKGHDRPTRPRRNHPVHLAMQPESRGTALNLRLRWSERAWISNCTLACHRKDNSSGLTGFACEDVNRYSKGDSTTHHSRPSLWQMLLNILQFQMCSGQLCKLSLCRCYN